MRARALLHRLVSTALTALIVLTSALAVTAYAAMRLDKIRVATVLTGSMEPTVPTGSVVIGTPLRHRDLRVGDLIMFMPPAPFTPPGNTPVVHRVKAIDPQPESGQLAVTTQGDANARPDPWAFDPARTTMYEVRAHSSILGTLATFGRVASWPVMLAVPVLLLTAETLRRIWRPTPASTARPRGPRVARHAA